MEVPRNSAEAQLVSMAKVIRIAYRGRFRGAFVVENIIDPEVQDQEVDEWITVKGRGGLALLDEAVVWYETQGETKRVFSSQPACAMLKTLIDEAKARGCFPSLDVAFTATEDSEGNAWNDSRTLEWRVNTSLLNVARRIAGLGIDFKVDYNWEQGKYTLYAYQSGRGSDKSASVVFRAGQNCREVTKETAGEELKNAYLLEYGQGQFSTLEDATSISAYRRRERGLSVGQAGSATEADEYGQKELNESKDPKENIVIEVEDRVEPMAFVDYEVGDWVGYYNREGNFSKYRIRGMVLDWGEDRRYAAVRLELNSIHQELEIRNAKSINKMGAGLPSDRSQPQDVVSSINTHNNDPNAHPNRDEFVELEDTPNTYADEGGKTVRVKSTEDGLEFVAIESDLAEEREATALNRIYSFLYGAIDRALTWVAEQTFQAKITVNQTGVDDIADFQDGGVSVVRVLDGGGLLLVPSAGGFSASNTGTIGYDSTKEALVFEHEGHNEPVPFDPRYSYSNFQYEVTY